MCIVDKNIDAQTHGNGQIRPLLCVLMSAECTESVTTAPLSLMLLSETETSFGDQLPSPVLRDQCTEVPGCCLQVLVVAWSAHSILATAAHPTLCFLDVCLSRFHFLVISVRFLRSSCAECGGGGLCTRLWF